MTSVDVAAQHARRAVQDRGGVAVRARARAELLREHALQVGLRDVALG